MHFAADRLQGCRIVSLELSTLKRGRSYLGPSVILIYIIFLTVGGRYEKIVSKNVGEWKRRREEESPIPSNATPIREHTIITSNISSLLDTER